MVVIDPMRRVLVEETLDTNLVREEVFVFK